jgi:hypothetical protein
MRLLFIILVVVTSCRHNVADLEKERNAIQLLLQQERKAHFERNADLFISEFSDSMISVNKGNVMTATPAARKERIQHYFNQSEFISWDDVAPPVIRFSEDASLAYAIIQKKVIIVQKDSMGKSTNDTTDFAWVSIYRKTGDDWKVECNVSTNK